MAGNSIRIPSQTTNRPLNKVLDAVISSEARNPSWTYPLIKERGIPRFARNENGGGGIPPQRVPSGAAGEIMVRRFCVRIRLVCFAFALLLFPGAPLDLHSQASTPSAPAAASASPSSPPDLSGLWMRLRDQGATSRGYDSFILDLGKVISPMTPWAAAKFKTTHEQYGGTDPRTVLSDPIFRCYPPGVPRIYLMNFPMQIVETDGQVLELFEYDHFVRRIYTDGRPHDKDQGPLWMGDTIGQWEGDTLVADSTSFNDKTLIDRVGHVHSDALHVVERIRRLDRGLLEIALTIEDPKAYTQPWSTKFIFQQRPDWKVMENVCEDNATFEEFNNKAVQAPRKSDRKTPAQ